ncbi:MAG TPA: cytochrome c oxidase subunit II [Candidatus Limnocylindria bacterium]|nr:cytochrome c oxidase subunit II [Candidatus Limnocylindria bacterium]
MQFPAPRSRMRTMLRVGAPLLLILLLGGCLLPPEPKTEAGESVFNLYLITLVLAAIVFVGVEGFILYAVFRYRRKPGDEVLPEQHHGNNLIEIIWTAIPTVIVLTLFTFSMLSLAEVEARVEGDEGVQIEVDGFQWSWQFHYQDPEVTIGGTAADPPVMVVPVGEPVVLTLTTRDVNHSFYVPDFLIKRDLIDFGPQREPNELRFTVDEVGTYAGQCAEFCGTQHADMTFVVEARERADYDAYLADLAAGEEPQEPAAGDCAVTVDIGAENVEFDISEFEVPADTAFCINFENREDIPHNVSIYDGTEALFTGDILDEAGTITYQVPALPAGEYQFICDVHPDTMVGDVIVTSQ